MTGEELERAIEFLIQSQVKAEARLDRNDRQIAETNRQLQIYAETQSQFIEIASGILERLSAQQARTERAMAESNARTDERIAEIHRSIAESNARTDERIAEINQRIADVNTRTDKLIAESNARTDERITETNKLIAEANAKIAGANTRIAEVSTRGPETDARLDRIAALVERNIRGGNGNS